MGRGSGIDNEGSGARPRRRHENLLGFRPQPVVESEQVPMLAEAPTAPSPAPLEAEPEHKDGGLLAKLQPQREPETIDPASALLGLRGGRAAQVLNERKEEAATRAEELRAAELEEKRKKALTQLTPAELDARVREKMQQIFRSQDEHKKIGLGRGRLLARFWSGNIPAAIMGIAGGFSLFTVGSIFFGGSAAGMLVYDRIKTRDWRIRHRQLKRELEELCALPAFPETDTGQELAAQIGNSRWRALRARLSDKFLL